MYESRLGIVKSQVRGYRGRRKCLICGAVLSYAQKNVPIDKDPNHRKDCAYLNPQKLKKQIEKIWSQKIVDSV